MYIYIYIYMCVCVCLCVCVCIYKYRFIDMLLFNLFRITSLYKTIPSFAACPYSRSFLLTLQIKRPFFTLPIPATWWAFCDHLVIISSMAEKALRSAGEIRHLIIRAKNTRDNGTEKRLVVSWPRASFKLLLRLLTCTIAWLKAGKRLLLSFLRW